MLLLLLLELLLLLLLGLLHGSLCGVCPCSLIHHACCSSCLQL
jgi:hypothetical protein